MVKISSEDLERAKAGDMEALGRAIAGSRALALSAARKLARKARRPDLVEDLAAAAIAGSSTGVGGLIAAAQTFNPSLGSWEGHAYSYARKAVRSELRFQVALSNRTDELVEELEPGCGSEDAAIAMIDARSGVLALTPRQRAAVTGVVTGNDVATDLGLAPVTVRSYLATARAKLASCR